MKGKKFKIEVARNVVKKIRRLIKNIKDFKNLNLEGFFKIYIYKSNRIWNKW